VSFTNVGEKVSRVTMSEFNVDQVMAFAVDIAKQAGRIILKGSEKRLADQNDGNLDLDEEIKKNTADLVTETDQATEKFVKDAIAKQYPSHKFIGEESWAAGEHNELTDEPHWIVDPIDGTSNFTRHFLMCCISIGITYKSRPTIGVVYAPFSDTLYYARTGGGSWMESPIQGKRQLPLARPLPLPSLRQAILAVEYGSDRSAFTLDKKLASFKRLAGDDQAGVQGGEMVSGVRSIGSAALSCCYIAQGSFDIWHEIGCWAWDVAAGAVIVQESGGLMLGGKEATISSLDSNDFGDITPDVLQGRKYLVVRAIGDSKTESGRDAQKRIVKSFFNAIDEWEAV
jgi:myo-inositol-1(or 4)-monophosphatase